MNKEALIQVVLRPFGRRPNMRSAVLLSVFSVALLSLFGWARHETDGRVPAVQETVDDDAHLFV